MLCPIFRTFSLTLAGALLTAGAARASDRFEPNDAHASAHVLTLPASEAALTIDPASDVDCFAFDGVAGDMLHVEVRPEATFVPLLLTLNDAAGNPIITGADGQISITLSATGRYLLDVTGAGGSETGPYAMTVETRRVIEDMYEPNGDLGGASQVALPVAARGMSIFPAADEDWFRFEAAEGDVVLATASPSGGSPRPIGCDLEIVDAEGRPLHGAPFNVTAVLPSSGTYYVKVTAFDPATTGDYDLQISIEQPEPDHLEPNDDGASATLAIPFFSDFLTVAPAGDRDLFQVDAGAGDVFVIDVSPGHFAMSAKVTLLDPTGAVVAQDGRSIRRSLPRAGRYTAVVEAASAGATGDYFVFIDLRPLPPDGNEPNDSRAGARTINPEPRFDLVASLATGDLDFFRFEAEAGSRVRVDISTFFGAVSALVGVFDSQTGAAIATGPFIDMELTRSSAYWVGITSDDDPGFTGARNGDGYGMSVTLIRPPRVIPPNHPFTFVGTFAGSAIASDPATGTVFELGRETAWHFARVEGTSVTESFPTPMGAGFFPHVSTDLEHARGFGGFDLFTADASGHIVAFDAAAQNGRVFATTGGGVEPGLAFAEGVLYASSGLSGPASIFAVDATGGSSLYMGPDRLSGSPSSLAISPDGDTLYYANAAGEIVSIDRATASEVDRFPVGLFDGFGAPNFAVDPATGLIYAIADGDLGFTGAQIIQLDPATAQVTQFADGLPSANDLTFGPCDGASQAEWCMFVTTGRGTMKIRGFSRPFEIEDRAGDATARLDVRGVDLAYEDITGAGSSTHLVASIALGGLPSPTAEYHLMIDSRGGTRADIDLVLSSRMGSMTFSGLAELGWYSGVSANVIRFVAPIAQLRRRATSSDRISVWVETRTTRPMGLADRAPDTGARSFRGFWPRLLLLPDSLDFGGVRVAGRTPLTVRALNTGVGALALRNVQVTGRAFAYEGAPPFSIPEGRGVALPISCDPPRPGSFTGNLRIVAESPVGARNVSLRCFGFMAPAPLLFMDARGDQAGVFDPSAPVPDLLGVSYALSGDEVVIRETFDRTVAINDPDATPPAGATVVVGAVELDLDRNPETGFCLGCGFGATYGIGAERQISFFSAPGGQVDLGGGVFGTARVINGDVLELRVPASWAGGGGCLTFGAIVGSEAQPGDWTPDAPGGVHAVTFGCAPGAPGMSVASTAAPLIGAPVLEYQVR